MKNKAQKILASLSLLSALASITAITGNPTWLTFLCFLSFLGFTKIKTDEKWKTNLDKAARNGFVVSLLCVVGLVVLQTFQINADILFYAILFTLAFMTFSFIISFAIYDRNEK